MLCCTVTAHCTHCSAQALATRATSHVHRTYVVLFCMCMRSHNSYYVCTELCMALKWQTNGAHVECTEWWKVCFNLRLHVLAHICVRVCSCQGTNRFPNIAPHHVGTMFNKCFCHFCCCCCFYRNCYSYICCYLLLLSLSPISHYFNRKLF